MWYCRSVDENSTLAQNILRDIIYGTVATVDENGDPWAAPQFLAYDSDAKMIYWCASRNSQHARNILRTGKAFVTVYDSSVGPGEGEGVYLQTKANALSDTQEITKAIHKLIVRHRGVPYWTVEDLLKEDAVVVVFRAKIIQSWVNVGHEDNDQFTIHRQPVEL